MFFKEKKLKLILLKLVILLILNQTIKLISIN